MVLFLSIAGADIIGIGQGMAIALAQAGAHVILAQRDVSNTETKDLIDRLPDSAGSHIVSADLNSIEDSGKVVSRALEVVEEIHILVNCGGMLIRDDSVDVKVEDWNTVSQTQWLSVSHFHQVLNVNLNSLFAITQAVGRHMIPLRRGKIINVTSLNASVGGFRVASYSASKGAVESLTKALSNEWAKYNITVNSIAPGSIATDM
jgi:2-deoxy-D-gluconate 3-dehydrogenase